MASTAKPTKAPEKKPSALEVCQSDAKKNRRFWMTWVIALAVVAFLLMIVAVYYWWASSTYQAQLSALAPPAVSPYATD